MRIENNWVPCDRSDVNFLNRLNLFI